MDSEVGALSVITLTSQQSAETLRPDKTVSPSRTGSYPGSNVEKCYWGPVWISMRSWWMSSRSSVDVIEVLGGCHWGPVWMSLRSRVDVIEVLGGCHWGPGWMSLRSRVDVIEVLGGCHWGPGWMSLRSRVDVLEVSCGCHWEPLWRLLRTSLHGHYWGHLWTHYIWTTMGNNLYTNDKDCFDEILSENQIWYLSDEAYFT